MKPPRTLILAGLFCLTLLMGQEYDSQRMGLVANPRYEYCSDVWGYADENGHDFALFGVMNGTVIMDVSTNPSSPTETGLIQGASSAWRDLKTHGDYLYVTNEGRGGLDIINLSDPWHPSLVKRYTDFSTAHNLYIADGYAYIVGSNKGGIRILDLKDPVNPVEVGSWETTYIHDIYVKNDTAYACALFDGDLYILDVSDKKDIQTLTVLDYDVYGCHAVWTTEDSRFIITVDEKPEGHVKIWDAQDYSNINLASEYEVGKGKSVHNVFVKGDKLFVSYYVFGTRVVDISDPYNPVEVGYFDLHPGSGGLYDGNWGTYPFTNSGLIYSTSMSGDGFFVLQYPFFVEFDHKPVRDTEDADGPYPITSIIKATEDNALVPETAMCISGLESDFTDTTYLAPGVKSGEFLGDIPGYGIAGKLTYYIAVQDTAGRWSTEPYGAPRSRHSFNVGPDSIPPRILSMTTFKNTVYSDGTQEISCEVDDNIGILDVRLIWRKNSADADSLKLSVGEEPNHYSGTFTWKGANRGDVFDYFLRVVDDTKNQNMTDSDTFQFKIASHTTIGDFENKDLSNWDTGDGWGFSYPSDVVGWVVNDSPGELYPNNANNSLTLNQPLDLSQFEEAYLGFNTFYVLETDVDFGYLEISVGGGEWTALDTVTGDWSYWEGKDEWEHAVIDLTDFLGQDEVYVRFRMTSNDSVTFLGWYVDDIEFWVVRYPLGAEADPVVVPEEFALLPNYPNPFNPTTTIVYQLPYEAEITLTIYDLLGRAVATLVSSREEAGRHAITWDADEVASGVYLCQLAVRKDGALRHVMTRKMTVIK